MSAQASFVQPCPPKLETLSACPVCSSGKIVTLYESLHDRIFGVPGSWTMWRCCGCDIAFLNPRLTGDAIGGAYDSYYTHAPAATESAPSIRSRFREVVIRSYAKRQLGATSAPHLVWAEWMVRRLYPGLAKHVAAQYRYLSSSRPGAALLDVGCGNGEFLSKVQALGWNAVGVEFDPKAHAVASSKGLRVVRGSVPNTSFELESFDAITLHHVIEHVHDPRDVLNEMRLLLKPGGTIVLTTPNWQSCGATFFGPLWRGLEPPRHLILFTPDALVKLVAEIGFVNAEIRVRPELAYSYFEQSRAIANLSPSAPPNLFEEISSATEQAFKAASRDSRFAEEFTLIATRPGTAA
jgi:2-polyprenyl-3-methyl-5-hydroxy-6-metoxy-1,4-benzoquinol methylase